MKRADLVVGEHYAHTTSRDWLTSGLDVDDAEVLSAEPLVSAASTRDPITVVVGSESHRVRARRPERKGERADSVLVRLTDRNGTGVRLVRTAELVGPLVEARERVLEVRARRARAAEDRGAERAANDELYLLVEPALRARGVSVSRFPGSRSVSVPLTVLASLLGVEATGEPGAAS